MVDPFPQLMTSLWSPILLLIQFLFPVPTCCVRTSSESALCSPPCLTHAVVFFTESTCFLLSFHAVCSRFFQPTCTELDSTSREIALRTLFNRGDYVEALFPTEDRLASAFSSASTETTSPLCKENTGIHGARQRFLQA